MFVQPKQKCNSDKMLIASTSSQPCSKPNVSGSCFCLSTCFDFGKGFSLPINWFIRILFMFKVETKDGLHYSFFPKSFVNCDVTIDAIILGTSSFDGTI